MADLQPGRNQQSNEKGLSPDRTGKKEPGACSERLEKSKTKLKQTDFQAHGLEH